MIQVASIFKQVVSALSGHRTVNFPRFPQADTLLGNIQHIDINNISPVFPNSPVNDGSYGKNTYDRALPLIEGGAGAAVRAKALFSNGEIGSKPYSTTKILSPAKVKRGELGKGSPSQLFKRGAARPHWWWPNK
jgi:hypothetical protein